MREVYKNIRKRRLELGMTQTELAEKVGYKGKSMIAKIETGVVDLGESKLSEIASALYTTPDALMGWGGIVTEVKDSEVQDFLQSLKDRSEMRMLFKSADGATKEQIEAIVNLLDSMKGQD